MATVGETNGPAPIPVQGKADPNGLDKVVNLLNSLPQGDKDGDYSVSWPDRKVADFGGKKCLYRTVVHALDGKVDSRGIAQRVAAGEAIVIKRVKDWAPDEKVLSHRPERGSTPESNLQAFAGMLAQLVKTP